jgi:hypothetical protein
MAFAWLLSGRAVGQPLPKLVVHRSEAAMDCPDADALARSVGLLMKRPALDPTPGSSSAGGITILIRGGPQGYTATIQAGDRSREIADPWPTCAGLAEGLPLTLAILLDSDEPLVSSPPPPVAPPTPSAKAGPTVPAGPAPRPEEKTTGLSIQIGAAATSGLLGPLRLGAQGDMDFRFAKTFAVGAGALWLAPITISLPPGEVSVSLWSAFVRGCSYVVGSPEQTRLALCAHAALGVTEGEGSGYFTNATAARPWIAFGGAALIEGTLWKKLGWATRLSFFIPAVQESFDVTHVGLAFKAAPIGVLFGIGGRVSIW